MCQKPSLRFNNAHNPEEKILQAVLLDVNIFGPSLIKYFESFVMQLVWHSMGVISFVFGGTGGLSVDGYIQWIKKGVSFTHTTSSYKQYIMQL